MTTDNNHPDPHATLFMHLVSMLAMSAMQQLGQLVNPASGKAERHLDAAQVTIDLLDMLAAKTRGNLGTAESKMLQDTLMSLKMTFVETGEHQPADSGQPSESGGPHTPATGTQPPDSAPAAPESEPPPGGGGLKDKSPRFRKSYG